MPDPKTIYAVSALRSLPRLLSLEDRNPFSQTYGCLHRDYWLYKTSDFPDAVRQFGAHALALAYARDLPNNPYWGNPQIRDWAIAALNFWASIQHSDGSFDEFYPYERGWVGPTAFTTYACGEAYRLLRPGIPPDAASRITTVLRQAARFIAAGQAEEDRLGNHHAMAVLAVSTVADILADTELRSALHGLWKRFLEYHDPEGWNVEYDGPDPGYLSATVSFLAKVYARHPSPELRKVLEGAVEFCSYFAYPDGSYAGILGSRNTLHFYPHGFELLAREIPLAASLAERLAQSLADGYLVPPDIMSDRYVHYRVPEFLLAALDAAPRPDVLPPLPYQRLPFVRVFPRAGIAATVHGTAYTVANLAKGGVVKSFDRETGTLLLNDSGWVGELTDGGLVTSQWIDPEFSISTTAPPLGANTSQSALAPQQDPPPTEPLPEPDVSRTQPWSVQGSLHRVPSAKLFTLWTNLLFRLALGLLGWAPGAAHWLKGRIRKSLILGRRPIPCSFRRQFELTSEALAVTDELWCTGPVRFRRLALGGELPVRYVPQSRFFQPHELESRVNFLPERELERLNCGELVRVVRTIPVRSAVEKTPVVTIASEHAAG